jgi:hypothetical protein
LELLDRRHRSTISVHRRGNGDHAESQLRDALGGLSEGGGTMAP